MTDEEYVRANWVLTHHCDGSYRDYPRGTILLQKISWLWEDFESWPAAAEFTRERKEEIRERQAEIEELDRWTYADSELLEPRYWQDMRVHVRFCRAIARLTAELETLRRGMKS